MDFTTLLLLVAFYVVLNLIRQVGKRRPGVQAPGELDDEAGPALEPPATRSGRPMPPPRGAKSPSAGATRLEEFLREFERRVAEAGGVPPGRGPMGRQSSAPLPGAEEVEELESLEVEPEVRALGGERVWEDREVPDEAMVADAAHRRRLVPEGRQLNAASHRAFDQRVRAVSVVADPEDLVKAARLARLREAIVVNEVLGKPKGLRGFLS